MELTILILAFLLCWTYEFIQSYKRRLKIANDEIKELNDFVKKSKNGIYLEWATSEQIIDEMSKRSNCKFIMLMPNINEDKNHIEIHVGNIGIHDALDVLDTAAYSIEQALEKEEGENEEEKE